MNSLSQSNTSLSSILCLIIITLLKIYTKSSIVEVSLYSLRYINFIKLSIITSILSYTMPMRGSFDNSNLVMKSRVTIDHGCSRVGANQSNLYSLWYKCFTLAQVSYCLIYIVISQHIFSYIKSYIISSNVLVIPQCLTIFQLC